MTERSVRTDPREFRSNRANRIAAGALILGILLVVAALAVFG